MRAAPRSSGPRRALLAVAAVLALSLSACAPLDVRLLSSAPRSVDALALPRATDTPGAEPSASDPPPTEPTTATPTEPTATPTPTETTPTAEPTPSESPTASASEASEPPDTESASAPTNAGDEGGGLPTWIPLLALGGLTLGALLLLGGRSRTRRWDDHLGVELGQAQWVLDELVPAMTNPATPPGELASHWAGAQTTLDQLQSGLAGLIADAPDAGRAASAQTLAGAVGEVRQAVAADLALRTAAGGAPPAAGPITPTDATVVAPGGAAGGRVDPTALAASAARVAAARERLAAAVATLA